MKTRSAKNIMHGAFHYHINMVQYHTKCITPYVGTIYENIDSTHKNRMIHHCHHCKCIWNYLFNENKVK